MSGLAALLAGRTERGVYRWHAAYDVADVRHTVEHAGWHFAHVDGIHVESVPELHTALADALAFPSYYGRNLDALHDSLSEVPVDTVLLWDAWGVMARAEPRVCAVALEVLGERISVLLRGEGPDAGVPSLD